MRPRNLLFCVLAGIGLGVLMIVAHIGPGIPPVQPASTPSYRNVQREQMLSELSSGLQQYYKDRGPLPVTLSNMYSQICDSYGAACQTKNYVDLSFLTTAGNYINNLPQDPLGGDIYAGSGFYIEKLSDGQIRIKAAKAELGVTLQTTFNL
jgi:hypothetical protein